MSPPPSAPRSVALSVARRGGPSPRCLEPNLLQPQSREADGGGVAFAVREARLSVRLEELLISQPDNGEQALEIVETLVRSGAVDLVVVDSVAALTRRPRSRATW